MWRSTEIKDRLLKSRDEQVLQSRSFNGLINRRSYSFALVESPAELLKELQQKEKVTLPIVVGAALGALIHRYTGQNEVSIEVLLPELSHFITLTLECEDNPRFRDLLHGDHTPVSSKRLDANYDSPTKYVVRDECMSLPTRVRGATKEAGTRREIIISFTSKNNQVQGMCEYDPQVYDEWFIHQLARHLQKLLTEAIADPSTRISRLNIFESGELYQILNEWNDTYRGYETKCVHELFEEEASRTPNAIALIYQDDTITYAGLNSRANQLAHYLRRQGVGLEVLVGVMLGRSIQSAIALLAVLKTGGAYVAIDASLPLARIKEVIKQAKLSLIIANQEWQTRLALRSLEIIDLDKESLNIQRENIENISSRVAPDNAAYVTFTSGSTGMPKGVVGIHRSITNGLTHAYFERDREGEVSCLLAPLSFAASVAPLLLPPCWGIPVVIMPEGQEKDPQVVSKTIERWKITSIIMNPTLFRQVLSLNSEALVRLKSIRTLALTGSAVTPDLIDAFKRIMPNAKLLIAYSASEFGGAATTKVITAENASEEALIGRAVPNVQVYILDRFMNPVPPGGVGEVYVAAAHLARGYLNQPDLTGERFLSNPFSVSPRERIFRTGDLARYHPNGGVELIGRNDDQVKIRGFRVELGEVEEALVGHPAVNEAAVTTSELEKDRRLIAYLAMPAGMMVSVTDLRRYLQQRLPEYMIPSSFVFLDHLPLTLNGKVDRNALPPPDTSRPVLESQYEESRNPVEAALSEIWIRVLGLEQIGIHDDFLDLGGDSLMAAQIVSSIRTRFGVEVPLPMFFEWLTISDLAAEISRCQEGKTLAEQVVGSKEKSHA
jgi:surfactin family lipopeptide synthetase A